MRSAEDSGYVYLAIKPQVNGKRLGISKEGSPKRIAENAKKAIAKRGRGVIVAKPSNGGSEPETASGPPAESS